jgi:hypothetical protein
MDSAIKHDSLAHVLEYDAATANLVACTNGHDTHGLAYNELSIFFSLSLGRHAALPHLLPPHNGPTSFLPQLGSTTGRERERDAVTELIQLISTSCEE